MPEIKEIQPALTAEEWAAMQSMPFTRVEGGYYVADMARSNWFLPDDDPRKITWDDVHAVRGAMTFDWVDAPDDMIVAREAELIRLAVKLVALLPPER